MVTDLFLPVLGQHASVTRVIIAGGEVEAVELQVEAVPRCGGLEDPQALGHDFTADSIAGDDGDAVRAVAAHSRSALGSVLQIGAGLFTSMVGSATNGKKART